MMSTSDHNERMGNYKASKEKYIICIVEEQELDFVISWSLSFRKIFILIS